MDLNKKIIRVGFIIIGIALVIGILFLNITKLKKPVFLHHYLEYCISSNDTRGSKYLELYYIANVEDNRNIVDISFEEAPHIRFGVSSDLYYWIGANPFSVNWNGLNRKKDVGRYQIRTLYVTIDATNLSKIEDNLSLSNAKVTFHNGESIHVNIGTISFIHNDNVTERLSSRIRSAPEDDVSQVEYAVKSTMTILDFKGSALNEKIKIVEMTLNNRKKEEVKGMNLSTGEKVNINTSFTVPKKVAKILTVYELRPIIQYRLEAGSEFKQILDQINYNPIQKSNYNLLTILQYLKARGEI
jgi:hypothetical protein